MILPISISSLCNSSFPLPHPLSSSALDRTSEGHARFLGGPPPGVTCVPASTQFKFVTECFFITQRALHVGLLPALNVFSQVLSDLGRQIQAEGGGAGGVAGGGGGQSPKGALLKKLYAVRLLYSFFVACL